MILTIIREGLGRIVILADRLTRPAPMQRDPADQQRVEAEIRHLSLYQFHACPFCIKTRRAMHRLNLPIELRDAQNDPVVRAQLLAEGGAIKVPCLRIQEPGSDRWLYESTEIIAYLDERFGSAAQAVAETR